jgi:hypothetical protein
MRRGFSGLSTLTIPALVVLALVGLSPRVEGQQPYKAPRTADGHPDLQGIWQAVNTASWNLEDHASMLGVPPGLSVVEGGEIPYKPEALAKRKKNFEERLTADPAAKCHLPGVPRVTYMPHPFQIFQNAEGVVIVYEYVGSTRTIYTSGGLHGSHPEGAFAYMGDPRGRWEGDTLVVDVVGFTDETWLDASGNYHSDALHVVERYTRTGPDHMRYEATIEDPNVFTRPWKISMPLYRRQERPMRLLEYYCHHDLEAAEVAARDAK